MIATDQRRDRFVRRRFVSDEQSAAEAVSDLLSQTRAALRFRGVFWCAAEATSMEPAPQALDCWYEVGNPATQMGTLKIQLAAGDRRVRFEKVVGYSFA